LGQAGKLQVLLFYPASLQQLRPLRPRFPTTVPSNTPTRTPFPTATSRPTSTRTLVPTASHCAQLHPNAFTDCDPYPTNTQTATASPFANTAATLTRSPVPFVNLDIYSIRHTNEDAGSNIYRYFCIKPLSVCDCNWFQKRLRSHRPQHLH